MSPYLYNRLPVLPKRKTLRTRQTPEERFLWRYLRGKKFHEYKFFRQYSVGPFILDFYCPKARLAIELDGAQHDDQEEKEYDVKRTRFLNEYDIRVIRFWNGQVRKYAAFVLSVIWRELRKGKCDGE